MLPTACVKLLRVVQTCSKLAGDLVEHVEQLVNYDLTYSAFALRVEVMTTNDVTDKFSSQSKALRDTSTSPFAERH